MDRALETVERVVLAFEDNFEGLLVIVSANFTAGHDASPALKN
jgi:hypothetical protein